MTKRITIAAFLSLLVTHIGAQQIALGTTERLQLPLPLHLNYATFYSDRANKEPIENVSEREFYSFSYYFKQVPKHLPPNKTWWIKFEISNQFERDTTVIFYPGFQNYVNAYHAAAGRFTKVGACGNMIPESELSIEGFRQALLLPVAAKQTSTFFIRIKNVTTYQVDAFAPYLMSKASLDNAQAQLLRNKRISDYIFFTGIGMFLIMLVYILIKWVYQKDVAYLYYALTIFGSSAYFLFDFFKEHNNQLLFRENPFVVHLLSDSFIFLSAFAYWKFVQKFLYIEKGKTFLGKFIHYGSRLILFLGIISLLYALLFRDVTGIISLNSTVGIFLLAGGVFILISIRKINQPLRRFVYGGVLSLLFFYTLGSLYELARNTSWNFFPESLGGGTPFLMMGNVLEMLFFTLGLAYRNKLETTQLANIGVQKAEAEMKALRAQMNPHFIFNCMHTIDAYIFKEQPDKASAFLNKFSKLIRQTLENSEQQLIPLSKELNSLRLYTELEQERYDGSFEVHFTIEDKALDCKIPPLLLQPFAENAILHGLRHLQHKKGELHINVKHAVQNLRITISDNGIGRNASEEINRIKGKLHTSMALDLTRQRLKFYHQGKLREGKVLINDLDTGTQTGTEVVICLPEINNL